MNKFHSNNIFNINMEKIYRQLAKKDNVSVEKVKNEMEIAISAMWEKQTPQAKKLFPNGKPTLDEFLIIVFKALENQK